MNKEKSAKLLLTVPADIMPKWRATSKAIGIPLTSVIRLAMKEYLYNHKEELEQGEEQDNDARETRR